FGSQYCQLIARRVRENHVHSRVFAPSVRPEDLSAQGVVGIILSGGPASTYEAGAPTLDTRVLETGAPVLGICYGMHTACGSLGAKVHPGQSREYGRPPLRVLRDDPLLAHLPADSTVWMSHGDIVTDLPADFISLATTPTCPIAVVRHAKRPFWGVQFHPEVTHTPHGGQILRNFLFDLCRCQPTWRA